MRRIGVTMEVTKRLFREFDITDEQFETLNREWSLADTIGPEAFMDFRDDVENDSDYEMDYAVTDEDGVTIINWD